MAKRSILLLSTAIALSLSLPTLAAPGEPEADPAKPAPVTRSKTVEGTATVGFTPAMKEAIRAYYKGKGCARDAPAPAAGCIPRRDQSTPPPYGVGKPLPSGTEARPLPKALADAVVAPEGYSFALVGSDVLLLAQDNNRVADTYPAIDPAAP